jgi:hypothetical protein
MAHFWHYVPETGLCGCKTIARFCFCSFTCVRLHAWIHGGTYYGANLQCGFANVPWPEIWRWMLDAPPPARPLCALPISCTDLSSNPCTVPTARLGMDALLFLGGGMGETVVPVEGAANPLYGFSSEVLLVQNSMPGSKRTRPRGRLPLLIIPSYSSACH